MTFSLLSSLARRALVPGALALSLQFVAQPAHAQETLDAAAAREHLTQGYKLKQQGQLREALPHLVESLRLDPKLKTMINLADCEERLGMLVEAQAHWVAARDKAAREDDARIKQEAQQRITALEARMPRLSIRLSAAVPSDAQIFRDDVLLGRVSLNTPLPTNPGEHKIIVRAQGYEDWRFTLRLNEKDNQVVNATIGPKSKNPPKPVAPPPPDASPATAPAVTPPPVSSAGSPTTAPPTNANPPPPEPIKDDGAGDGSSPGTVQRVLAIVAGGLGLGAFGVAGLYWQKASSDIKIEPDGRKRAQDDLLITNVGLVSGSVLVTAGVVLWLTAPSGKRESAYHGVQPTLALGKNSAFLGASGSF